MQKGDLHICALTFLAPQLLLSPPIPREPELQNFDLQWLPAAAAACGESLPTELQGQAPSSALSHPTVGPSAAPWHLYVSQQHSAEKGWKKSAPLTWSWCFCRFAVFSKGSCSPSSRSGNLAAQLSHWSLSWAGAREMAVSGLITNCSFPHTASMRIFGCAVLSSTTEECLIGFPQPLHRNFHIVVQIQLVCNYLENF